MSEREDAIKLANHLLDVPNVDPDDDLRMLSRQLLRHVEIIEQYKKESANHYDPMKYLIEANRDEILRKHEEAVRRIQRCLKRGEYDLADKVIEALWKFHPMHCESWCGWPEGTDE